MREQLILTTDEAVDPVERLECPRCGTEFSISPDLLRSKECLNTGRNKAWIPPRML